MLLSRRYISDQACLAGKYLFTIIRWMGITLRYWDTGAMFGKVRQDRGVSTLTAIAGSPLRAVPAGCVIIGRTVGMT